jgi:AraC family transcriptional regulator of adaptative response/methylated-DNA-[protein]-cysteine methyltransferase
MIHSSLPIESDSTNSLNDLFSKWMDIPSSIKKSNAILKAACLNTPLGTMVAISDDRFLYFLEFLSQRGLEHGMRRLKQSMSSIIIPGCAQPTYSIEAELQLYFSGKLQQFTTPLFLIGSDFQKKVWAELKKIPYGETRSYLEVAKSIQYPSAFRAVARANSTNRIAIVIPCHRVINHNGKLGGYAGGLDRKEWLLHFENSIKG